MTTRRHFLAAATLVLPSAAVLSLRLGIVQFSAPPHESAIDVILKELLCAIANVSNRENWVW